MKSFRPFLIMTLGVAMACGTSACSTMKNAPPPLKTVDHVDLDRYMGDWYVIAHIPYALEKGKVGTLDRYAKREDGRIDNIFLFRKGSLDAPLKQWKGVAWVHNEETNAEWRVQFLWPLRVPYLIIGLDDDYQWSLIGYPNRKLAWILSRKPVMDQDLYESLLDRLEAQGYERSAIVRVPQIVAN